MVFLLPMIIGLLITAWATYDHHAGLDEEEDDFHPIPDADWSFEPGQQLIVYGDLQALQAAFGPEEP